MLWLVGGKAIVADEAVTVNSWGPITPLVSRDKVLHSAHGRLKDAPGSMSHRLLSHSES